MPSLDATFAALSNDTRRKIVRRLARGEATLSALAGPFAMSQPAVSKHVRVLSEAGLVIVEKRGRSRHCRLDARRMKQASAWLTDVHGFWMQNFDNLARHLAKEGT